MSEITLIGYGNQGKAWAKNLRDSGWSVTISGRGDSEGGKGIALARSEGFPTLELAQIAEKSSPIAFLLPDEEIPKVYAKYFTGTEARVGRSFIFAHGFSVVYGRMAFAKSDDVVLVAPKGIGVKLRERYEAGSGVMGVLGVAQDASGTGWDLAREVGRGLGCDRVGMVESSFAEETNADLLSEQVILCGALPRLVRMCVEFLVDKGIHPKVATYECLNEAELIIGMMVRKGIAGMYGDVSTTAKFGGLRAAERILPEMKLRAEMEKLWSEIVSGEFAAELAEDMQAGKPRLKTAIAAFDGNTADKNL